jgi:hypothetical protein
MNRTAFARASRSQRPQTMYGRLVRSHGHIFILMDDGYELFFLRHKDILKT